MSKIIIYDTHYLNKKKIDFVRLSLIWPTSLNLYLKTSNSLHKSFLNLIKSKKFDRETFDLLIIIFPEIMLNAEKILKIVIDCEEVHKKRYNLKFDIENNPLLFFIYFQNKKFTDFKFSQNKELNYLNLTFFYKVKKIIKKFLIYLALSFSNETKRIDLHNLNNLAKEYLDHDKRKKMYLRLETLLDEFSNDNKYSFYPIIDKFNQILKRKLQLLTRSEEIIEKACFIFNKLICDTLENINYKNNILKNKNFKRFLGDYLVGGSPKLTGRLLNHFYQRNGKTVNRFSHGGDRMFFYDKLWYFSELNFVDNYFCHSTYEAKIQLQKYCDRSNKYDFISKTHFQSIGSSRHKKIWKQHKFKRKLNAKRKILFILGSFLGEKNMTSLAFKLPDILTLDLMLYTHKILDKQNYEFYVKPHPKGINKDLIQNKFKNLNVFEGDFLNPTNNDFDCFIFEFAGSAFYDSLLTNKGIVLLDTGIRPWYDISKNFLKQRCEMIKTFQNKNNMLRFLKSSFLSKVKIASNFTYCKTSFAKSLF